MTGKFRLVLKASVIATLGCSGGMAFAQASSTTTAQVSNPGLADQPSSNPGQYAGLITMRSLDTSNIIGGAVSNATGGGAGGFAGGIRRFALPGQGDSGVAGAPGGKSWIAWVAYSRSDVAYSFVPRQASGNVEVALVGVDYTLANNMIVGVALAGDRTRIDTTFNGGTPRGNGYTIAPYIGVPINRALTFDASIGYGRTKLDTNFGATSGSFNSDRLVGNIGLAYRQSVGNWLLTGRGSYISAQDKLGSYTLSNGTFVSSGDVNVSQIRLGGQAAYNAGSFVPYVGLTYIYDIRRPEQQAVGGTSAANDRDAWTPVIGIQFKSGGALYGGIQYSSEQSRSQVKNNQLLLNIGARF